MKFETINIYEEHRILDILKRIVCRRFFISNEQLLSNSRKGEITKPRQLVQSICKDVFQHMSMATVGKYTGNKDHATVLHAHNVWNNTYRLSKTDDKLYNEVKSEAINIILKERTTGFPCYEYLSIEESINELQIERNKLAIRIRELNDLEEELKTKLLNANIGIK